MSPSSPAPPPSRQMGQYPPHTSDSDLSYPLLSTSASSSSSSRNPNHQRVYNRQSSLSSSAKRLWRPLLAISSPFLLVFLYACIHPHVPGLPALPTVHISTGDEGRYTLRPSEPVGDEWREAYPEMGEISGMSEVEAKCTCGEKGSEDGGRLCEVYRPQGLESSRLVQGSGARMRRALLKAKEGKGLKIGVLGGSVSACHGVHPSPDYPQGNPAGPGCYTTLVKEWFETKFPGVEHEFENGAIGGMDSSYYAFCGTHHIPTDADVIILEFDVNDQTDLIYQSYFDQLLRVLLEFKSQPAVIILGAWSPQVAQDQGYGDPQIVHLPIAHYYDIPYISQKRIMWNEYLRYPHSTAKSFFQPDRLHPNARGHRLLADLLVSYLETELCLLARFGLPISPSASDTISTPSEFSSHVSVPFALDTLHLIDPVTAPPDWASSFDPKPLSLLPSESRQFVLPFTPYAVPPIGLFTPLRDVVDPSKPDPEGVEHIKAIVKPKLFCADANDKVHPMKPTSSKGWEKEVWNGEKHFWRSGVVGARIRVEIKVMAGRVAVYYYRSQKYNLGDAKCWVDDNVEGAVSLAGWWDKQYNVAVVAYIDEKVTPGDHYVTCEIMEETSHPEDPKAHNWRLVAVMAT